MNLDRKLFGRVTIDSKPISLGHATIVDLAKRLIEQYRLARASPNGKVSILVEISHDRIPELGLLDEEQQLLRQFNSMLNESSLDEPTDWPGITMSRVVEVSAMPEFEAYKLLATNPNKRLGLTQLQIERIREAYRRAAPDCFEHFPKWIDS